MLILFGFYILDYFHSDCLGHEHIFVTFSLSSFSVFWLGRAFKKMKRQVLMWRSSLFSDSLALKSQSLVNRVTLSTVLNTRSTQSRLGKSVISFTPLTSSFLRGKLPVFARPTGNSSGLHGSSPRAKTSVVRLITSIPALLYA